MALLRRLEVFSGACLAGLSVFGIIAAFALPTFAQRGTALDASGHVISVQTVQGGFFQQVGTPLGIAILAALGILALCLATIILVRGSHLSLATLFFLWVLAGLLTYAALAATITLGPNFWPSAALGIVCAVLATVQFIRQPGRLGAQ